MDFATALSHSDVGVLEAKLAGLVSRGRAVGLADTSPWPRNTGDNTTIADSSAICKAIIWINVTSARIRAAQEPAATAGEGPFDVNKYREEFYEAVENYVDN